MSSAEEIRLQIPVEFETRCEMTCFDVSFEKLSKSGIKIWNFSKKIERVTLLVQILPREVPLKKFELFGLLKFCWKGFDAVCGAKFGGEERV